MSTWNVYVYNTGTLAWDLDGTIPRPNDNLSVSLVHNQQRIKLADGSDAFLTPETRTAKQQLNMVWIQQDKDFVDQIETWMNNHDYLKIETHLASYNYIGRFVGINPVWKVGEDEIWDVQAIFEVME